MIEEENKNTKPKTIDDVIEKSIKDNVSEPNEIEVFGFSGREINEMKDTFLTYNNPEPILDAILTKLLQDARIRSLSNIDDKADASMKSKRHEIMNAFICVQQLALVKKSVKRTKVKTKIHSKGDLILDDNGNPTPVKGTNGNKTYTKDIYEITDEIEEIETPYFDVRNSPKAWRDISKIAESFVVVPNFEKLYSKTCSNIDFNRGLDIIRNLSKYYIFEDPDKFVKRFSLFICNAKSRVLNIQPKWPVMFSLVGTFGIGKSWLAEVLMAAHDDVFEAQSCESKYSVILDRFNAPMLTRGIIHLDEKNGLDMKGRETFKTYVTGSKITVELKNQQPKTVTNLATFLSTTNESIKDIVGLQQDRRIVEFSIVGRRVDENGRRLEIDEKQLYEWFKELWMVMPVENPYADEIKDELLYESSDVLDTTMYPIIRKLWVDYKDEFITNKNLRVKDLKEVIKKMGGIRANDVVNWCEANGLWKTYNKGTRYIVHEKWDEIVSKQLTIENYDPYETEDKNRMNNIKSRYNKLMEG